MSCLVTHQKLLPTLVNFFLLFLEGRLMKYFALLLALSVFAWCNTADAQYTEPGSGSSGTYTEPGTGTGGGYTEPGSGTGGGYTEPGTSGGGGYTEPDNPHEDDWIATTWGSFSGTTLIKSGTEMIKWGLTTTGVLVGDDATVVGVVDDPLILISGGTVVVGGVVLVIGGIKVLIETWSS